MTKPTTYKDQQLAEIRRSVTFAVIRARLNYVLDAYETCVVALNHHRDSAEETVRKRMGLWPDDVPPPSVYVDGYGWSPDFQDEGTDLDQQMETTLAAIRVAFMIALYHGFEKQALFVTGGDNYEQAIAIADLQRRGVTLNIGKLNELRLAVNASKHGPKSSAMKSLLERRPDLVENGEITVSPEQLELFFDIFREMSVYAGP